MSEQPWRGMSPEVARLQDQADAAQARFDDLAVVADAEGSVAGIRQDELAATQRRAWRRVSAARGQLTRAQRGGDPEAIRAAQDRLDARYREADDIAHAGITEMHEISRVRLAQVGEMIDMAAAATRASAAVTEAIQVHAPQKGSP